MKYTLLFIVAIFALSLGQTIRDDGLEVTLPNGSRLVGHTKYKSVNKGRTIRSYQGIPFAKSPVGDLRLAKPVEAPKWEGQLQADKQYICSQLDFVTFAYKGQEDCLYLNVYVPEGASQSQPLPVMFWIHGGGWFAGDATTELYGPERLMDKDVILVTTNYRVGPLGFLTMLDDELPGNIGLLDQQLAMKWVQKNIKAFGGDPNKVTIFGESAGSASVLYHVLSPHNKGLFHAAIAQSGSPLSTFALIDQHPAHYARSLADKVGCNPDGSSKDIKKCLLKTSASDLVTNQLILSNIQGVFPLRFIPTTDGDFIPKPPLEMLEKGEFNQVPIINGFNKDEGYLITWRYLHDQHHLDDLKRDLEKNLLTIVTGKSSSLPFSQDELDMAKELVTVDLGGQELVGERSGALTKLTQMIGDTWFNAIGMKTNELLAKKSNAPVFEYLYTHEGTATSLLDVQVLPRWKLGIKALGRLVGLDLFHDRWGVSHADEIFMLFKAQALPFDTVYDDADRATCDNMVELWTNFAITVGNPTPEKMNGVIWKKINPNEPERLVISSKPEFGRRSESETSRLRTWEKRWEKLPPSVFPTKQEYWKESAKTFVKKSQSEAKKNEL